jgi:hypothetical protein
MLLQNPKAFDELMELKRWGKKLHANFLSTSNS